jgi:hypothetical protein
VRVNGKAKFTTKVMVLGLLPLLGACSLTANTGTSTLKTSRTVPAAEANLGPSQYANVSVPSRSEILGQSPTYLAGLLGAPSLKRTEHEAELWQYQSASCVALFYLYEVAGSLKVNHYDARARSDAFGKVSEELCLKEIVGTFGRTGKS